LKIDKNQTPTFTQSEKIIKRVFKKSFSEDRYQKQISRKKSKKKMFKSEPYILHETPKIGKLKVLSKKELQIEDKLKLVTKKSFNLNQALINSSIKQKSEFSFSIKNSPNELNKSSDFTFQ